MNRLTVILCGRPNEEDFTRRHLETLKVQTLPSTQWDLVVPCIGGRPAYDKECVKSSGLRAREMDFPSTDAGAVWVQASKSIPNGLFVFVGQRTLLEADYLENVVRIAEQFPWLGVWGGAVQAGDDYELPEWVRAEPWLLGCQPVTTDRWANSRRGYELDEAFPYCGPLCLRASAIADWAKFHEGNRIKGLAEDPNGASELQSRLELAFALHHLRWGTGLFQRLRATHVVRPEEADVETLSRQLEGIEFTRWSLLKWWGWTRQIPVPSGPAHILGGVRRQLTWSGASRRLFSARMRGRSRAARLPTSGCKDRLDSTKSGGLKADGRGNARTKDEWPLQMNERAGLCLMSVVICTYNPRKIILERTLQALCAQTLPREHWELLIIDNNSVEPVADWARAPWHKSFRVIQEPKQGIAEARARGLQEARGEFVLFVDDDNILDCDYLAAALRIGRDHPQLGVWGGIIELDFETEPPAWIDQYRPLLAERRVEADQWSNLTFDHDCTPVTAGLCLRREVGQAFVERMSNLPPEFRLGRQGSQLTNCEDIDLAWTACKLGWGMGLFRKLRLTHLIPPGRLEEDYLLRLQTGTSFSFVLLHALWGEKAQITLGEKFARWFQILSAWDRPRRAYLTATFRGQQRAVRWLATAKANR